MSFSQETGGPSHLPPYDPILVINYYVEVEYENELARRRIVTPPPAPPPDLGEELPHNTIVSLPKINKLVGRERERENPSTPPSYWQNLKITLYCAIFTVLFVSLQTRWIDSSR